MIQDFIRYFKFTDGIATSDVIGWLITVMGAILIYRWIDNMQTSMSRHSMLREIEASFSAIYNSTIAKGLTQKIESGEDHAEANTAPNEALAIDKCEDVMVRSVLHDFTNWEIHKNGNGFICEIVNSQRYLLIRDNKTDTTHYYEWISTQALHEILLITKRIEKMFKDKIIKKIDLCDMSYEIIPLGRSGRIEMFEDYYSKYEADCIAYLVMQTVVACNKYKNQTMVQEFKEYYASHPAIKEHFTHSVRIRRFRDYFTLKKFIALMR